MSVETSDKRSSSPMLIPLGAHAKNPPIKLTRPVYVVGSKANCRIHLVSSTVSITHAILVQTRHITYIRDLCSRSHVYVNGEERKESILHDGDLIAIGRFKFKYQGPAKDHGGEPAAGPAALEVAGSELPIVIENRAILIGRRPNCEIPLLEPSVSTAHAVLFAWEGKRFVRDLWLRTGTFVNGKAVHESELHPGDLIRIGETDITYAPSVEEAAFAVIEGASDSIVAATPHAEEMDLGLEVEPQHSAASAPLELIVQPKSPPAPEDMLPLENAEAAEQPTPHDTAHIPISIELGSEISAARTPPAKPPIQPAPTEAPIELEPLPLSLDEDYGDTHSSEPIDAPLIESQNDFGGADTLSRRGWRSAISEPIEPVASTPEVVRTPEIAAVPEAVSPPEVASPPVEPVVEQAPEISAETIDEILGLPHEASPVAEVIAPTEPTPESALTLPIAEESKLEMPSAADMTDTTFGRSVEEFEGESLGPIIEEPAHAGDTKTWSDAAIHTPVNERTPADEIVEAEIPFTATTDDSVIPLDASEDSSTASPVQVEPDFAAPMESIVDSTVETPVDSTDHSTDLSTGDSLADFLSDTLADSSPESIDLHDAAPVEDSVAEPVPSEEPTVADLAMAYAPSVTADAVLEQHVPAESESPADLSIQPDLPQIESAANAQATDNQAEQLAADSLAASAAPVEEIPADIAAEPVSEASAAVEPVDEMEQLSIEADEIPSAPIIEPAPAAEQSVELEAEAPAEMAAEFAASISVEPPASNAEMPQFEAAEIEAPEIESSDVEETDFDAPQLESPEIDLADIDSPNIDSPDTDSPDIDSPDLEAIEVEPIEVEPIHTETPIESVAPLEVDLSQVITPDAPIFDVQALEAFTQTEVVGDAVESSPVDEVRSHSEEPKVPIEAPALSVPVSEISAPPVGFMPPAEPMSSGLMFMAAAASKETFDADRLAAPSTAITPLDESAAMDLLSTETDSADAQPPSSLAGMIEIETNDAATNASLISDTDTSSAAPEAMPDFSDLSSVDISSVASDQGIDTLGTFGQELADSISPAVPHFDFTQPAVVADSLDSDALPAHPSESLETAPAVEPALSLDDTFPTHESLPHTTFTPPSLDFAGQAMIDQSSFVTLPSEEPPIAKATEPPVPAPLEKPVPHEEEVSESPVFDLDSPAAEVPHEAVEEMDILPPAAADEVVIPPPITDSAHALPLPPTESPVVQLPPGVLRDRRKRPRVIRNGFGQNPGAARAGAIEIPPFSNTSAGEGMALSSLSQPPVRETDVFSEVSKVQAGNEPTAFSDRNDLDADIFAQEAAKALATNSLTTLNDTLAAEKPAAVEWPFGMDRRPMRAARPQVDLSAPRSVVPLDETETDEAANLRHRKLMRRALVLVCSMVVLIAGACAAIVYFVPVRNKFQATLTFKNFSELPQYEQRSFQAAESQLLAGNTRNAAIRVLQNRHPDVAPGFLNDPDQYGTLINHPETRWSDERGKAGDFIIRYDGADAAHDRDRLEAVALALYEANHRYSESAQTLQANAAKLEARIADAARQIENLNQQEERERATINALPAQDKINKLKQDSSTLEKAYNDAIRNAKEAQADLDKLNEQKMLDGTPSHTGDPVATDKDAAQFRQQVASLTAKLAEARQHRADLTAQARKTLDSTYDEFKKQVDAAQAAAKTNPELAAFVSAAQNLQQTIRDLTDQYIEQQQKDYADINKLKSDIDSKHNDHLAELMAKDPKLQDLVSEKEILTRKYSAAIGSGDPKLEKEGADVQDRLKLVESMIKAQQEVVANDPVYSVTDSGLQKYLNEKQRDIATQRTKANEKLAQLRAEFSKSVPAVEKLPADQKELASAMRDRLAQIDAARKQYAEAADAANADADLSIKRMNDDLEAAQLNLKLREKQVLAANSPDVIKSRDDAQNKALAQKGKEVEELNQAVAAGQKAYQQNQLNLNNAVAAADAAHSSADHLLELKQKRDELQKEKQTNEALWDQAKVSLARTVEPIKPNDYDIVKIGDATDERMKYCLYSGGSVFVLFTAWIILTLLGAARHSPRAHVPAIETIETPSPHRAADDETADTEEDAAVVA